MGEHISLSLITFMEGFKILSFLHMWLVLIIMFCWVLSCTSNVMCYGEFSSFHCRKSSVVLYLQAQMDTCLEPLTFLIRSSYIASSCDICKSGRIWTHISKGKVIQSQQPLPLGQEHSACVAGAIILKYKKCDCLTDCRGKTIIK